MGHQRVLDAIHWRDFRGDRVHPIDRLSFLGIFKRGLMLRAQQGTQIDMPIAFVLFPPVKINVKGGIDSRFDETKTFSFDHPGYSNSLKRKYRSPTCENSGLLPSSANNGAGGTRLTIFTAE